MKATAYIKAQIHIDRKRLADCRIEIMARHTRAWKPLLVIRAGDVINFVIRKKVRKR